MIFFSTSPTTTGDLASSDLVHQLPNCPIIGEIPTMDGDTTSRIKDFEILNMPGSESTTTLQLLITASSDGSIFVWTLDLRDGHDQSASFDRPADFGKNVNVGTIETSNGQGISQHIPQVGRLLGRCETGSRITCLKAFVMMEAAEENGFSRSVLSESLHANGGPEETSDDASD